MKNLPRWLKIVFVSVLTLIIFFGGPIAINEAYKTGKGYITMWGAADVLSFYGIIIASLGAAVGVFISIAYSRKQYSDDKRRDVLPYFAINILRRKCVDPFLIGWYSDEVKPFSSDLKTKEDLTYREYLYNKGYFVFLSDHIEYKTRLSDGQEKAVQTGMEIKDYDGHAQVWQTNVFYIPIELQNVGNGCAINTKIDITAFKRIPHQVRYNLDSIPATGLLQCIPCYFPPKSFLLTCAVLIKSIA